MSIRPRITTKQLAVAFFALTPFASQADGLRFPFTGSLQGAGIVVLPVVPPRMSARAMWKADLALGELKVPVKLYAAVRDTKIHFRLPIPEVRYF